MDSAQFRLRQPTHATKDSKIVGGETDKIGYGDIGDVSPIVKASLSSVMRTDD